MTRAQASKNPSSVWQTKPTEPGRVRQQIPDPRILTIGQPLTDPPTLRPRRRASPPLSDDADAGAPESQNQRGALVVLFEEFEERRLQGGDEG
ncbi:hypothetical protein KC352_g36628 [Hortaea werneckii]|nr:hypothetical protein KC352_g36628 [Hortaea werneckii]KAI7575605.1 hypothetical protein KC346_g19922 [Hortaea werneckii]